MSPLTNHYDRSDSTSVADIRHTTGAIVAEWADLALHHADSGMPRAGRRFLSEAKRRDYSVRRARMFQWWDEFYDWMAFVPATVATHGPERMRGRILALQPTPDACLVSAVHLENRVGDKSDVFERMFLAEQIAARVDGVIDGWRGQLEVTRQGLDVAHVVRARKTFSLPQ